MPSRPTWLPELVEADPYNGDWERYVAVLYRYFAADFIEDRPYLAKQPVKIPGALYADGRVLVFCIWYRGMIIPWQTEYPIFGAANG